MSTFIKTAVAAVALSVASSALAVEIFKDYTPSKEVYHVSFIQVKPNRIDDYFEGLRQTWLSACDAQIKAGVTLECGIYLSETSANRDFNLMLVVKQPSAAVSDPNEKVYNEVTAAIRAKLAQDKADNIVSGYEEMRSFFGEQTFREITFK